MYKELINNFWLAILEKELIVHIDNNIINHENIYTLIKELYPDLYESGQYNNNPNPRPYIEAYKKINCISKTFEENIDYLGAVKLIISKNKEYQGRIANFRKSKMLIWKDPSFLYKGYCGVFICNDPKGNSYLKSLENATHTEWKANNWKHSDAIKVIKAYKEFIKQCVNKILDTKTYEELTIDAFDKFLSLTKDRGHSYQLKKTKPALITHTKRDRDSKYIPKTFNWIRNKAIKTTYGYKYEISMHSKINHNKVCFEVLVGNDDNSASEKVNIKNCVGRTFNENQIKLELEKGENQITLILDDFLKHSIRLKEIKNEG